MVPDLPALALKTFPIKRDRAPLQGRSPANSDPSRMTRGRRELSDLPGAFSPHRRRRVRLFDVSMVRPRLEAASGRPADGKGRERAAAARVGLSLKTRSLGRATTSVAPISPGVREPPFLLPRAASYPRPVYMRKPRGSSTSWSSLALVSPSPTLSNYQSLGYLLSLSLSLSTARPIFGSLHLPFRQNYGAPSTPRAPMCRTPRPLTLTHSLTHFSLSYELASQSLDKLCYWQTKKIHHPSYHSIEFLALAVSVT
jgi:hypothetical protein